MQNFEKQQGISFLIISFTKRNELYYMRFSEILSFWERAQKGGRKSIRYEELTPEFFIHMNGGAFIPYLDMVQKDLELRDTIL